MLKEQRVRQLWDDSRLPPPRQSKETRVSELLDEMFPQWVVSGEKHELIAGDRCLATIVPRPGQGFDVFVHPPGTKGVATWLDEAKLWADLELA